MEDHAPSEVPATDNASFPGPTLPLSPAQLGVYFGHLRDSSGGRFNIGQVTAIAGDLDVEIFRLAAADVIIQTPALNMAIVPVGDMPRQVPVDRSAVTIPFYDLRGAPDPAKARSDLLERLTFAPFDLAKDPLFRWVLVQSRTGQVDWVQVYQHIVVDDWSGQLLNARVSRRYSELLAKGIASGVHRSEPDAYAAHIASEAAYQTSEVAARDGVYWRNLLADVPLVEPLEVKRHPPGGCLFVRESIVIEGKFLDSVASRAKELGVTTGHVVTAAAALLEAFGSQSSDIVLGTPLLGRFGTAARSVVSMSSNVGHLRVRDVWSHSVGSLLTEIKSQQLAGLRRQRYRYEDLRRDILSAGSDASFAHLQVRQMSFDKSSRFGGLLGATVNLSNGPIDGLCLAVDPLTDGRLRIDLDGVAGAYNRDSLRHLAERLVHILQVLAEGLADRSLGSLCLTPASGLARIAGFNATDRATPPGVLPDLLSDRAVERGSAAAVVFGEASLSYAELEARSNALARHLISLGVGPDAVVAIALPRSFEMVVALVAVLKAGGAYLPLDPEYPEERLRYMLGDSRADVLLSRSDVLAQLGLVEAAEAEGKADAQDWADAPDRADVGTAGRAQTPPLHRPSHILCLEDTALAATLAAQSTARITDADRRQPLRPGHLAYVIYTSGSTGRPKGVGISLHSLATKIARLPISLKLEGELNVAWTSSPSFDPHIEQLWLGLTLGSLTIIDDETRQNLQKLDSALVRGQVDLLNVAPAFLATFSGHEWKARPRYLLSGGELLKPAVAESAFCNFPGTVLLNMYGPPLLSPYPN